MRTLLVDDHALFRDGDASLLLAWGHEVEGEAAREGEAVDAVDETSDVVLMNVRSPADAERATVDRVDRRRPEVAIFMLTVSEEDAGLFRAIKAGAQGSPGKSVDAPQLRSILEGVAQGETAMGPAAAARIVDEFLREPGAPKRKGQRLTERELEVLELVTAGHRNRQIAADLGISENTVKFHLKNIVEKLHAQNRAELAARAVREGLVPNRRRATRALEAGAAR